MKAKLLWRIHGMVPYIQQHTRIHFSLAER